MEKMKHSAFGVASFFMGVIFGLLATFFVFVVATMGYLSPLIQGHRGALYALFFALLFGNFVALILGIVSFFQKNKRKLFGLMGAVFSAGILFLNVGLFIIIDSNF